MSRMISMCGLVCTDCPAYKAKRADDQSLREETAAEWSKMYGSNIKAAERIEEEDITVISDQDREYPSTPGIRLSFNMKVMLDLVNQHALSTDSLAGMLRSFGIPRIQ